MKRLLLLGLVAATVAGCNTDMWRQPKQAPLDASDFFADGMGDRPLVPGTIARDHLREDDTYFTGISGGKFVDKLPMPLTLDLLKRGQERYKIYCTPCHGQLGDGEGMISHRGFRLVRLPGNYHTPRLRNMPIGHFYDVITNGYGAMFSYASRVEPQDRWAIAAYIRVLQLSQHATPTDADASALQNSQKSESITPAAAPERPAGQPIESGGAGTLPPGAATAPPATPSAGGHGNNAPPTGLNPNGHVPPGREPAPGSAEPPVTTAPPAASTSKAPGSPSNLKPGTSNLKPHP